MGATATKRFGLSGTTPDKPHDVLTQGKFVLGNLRDSKLAWPERRGVSIDRSAFTHDLAARVSALEAARDAVIVEAKELDATKVAKDADIEMQDRVFGFAAGLGWEAFKLGGQLELAERIRPSLRRPGQTEVEPPEPTPPA